VIRVAVAALGALDFVAKAVKAEPFPDVLGDLLVAAQTQTGLRLLAEGLVAQLALILVLGVTCDHFPRHDEALQNGRCSNVRRQQHQRQETRDREDCSVVPQFRRIQ
jgi:hypothetical protein